MIDRPIIGLLIDLYVFKKKTTNKNKNKKNHVSKSVIKKEKSTP